jgi:hypothetical protein
MDTDVLRPYQPGSAPSIEGGQERYIAREFAKLAQSIALLAQVMVSLEERIVALEPP